MTNEALEFRSDNCGRAAPEILEALVSSNNGNALGYGGDAVTAELHARMSALFERPVRVFPIPTGTGANALALAATTTPFSAVYCSPESHINTSECNAAGFFGSGLKVTALSGQFGKLDPSTLQQVVATAGKGQAHKSQPAAVNIVQATDLGAVYTCAEVTQLGTVAKNNGLVLHMDGARFANAVAHLGCSPAELTWKAGVDILSFGVTKNGGLLTDAIVVFNDDIANDIGFHLRRAGMIWSKMRFASSQVLAYIKDDLWLRLARQSNGAAAVLANAIAKIDGARIIAPVEANEVFLTMRAAALDQLAEHGVLFYRRGPELARLVCRWDTTEQELQQLIALIKNAAASSA
ncbi:MAG: threonine aldolase family protein [Betaproteobacteria bacterium]